MSNPLVAFALVAEEYERSGDPIKGLAPLFRPILSSQSGQVFNSAKFAEDFSAFYGFEMKEFVANALRPRLAEAGLLVEIGRDEFHVAEIDGRLDDTIFASRIEETADLFRTWATSETERIGKQFDGNLLEEALFSRLARPEFSSIFLGTPGELRNAKVRALLGKAAVDPMAQIEPLLDYLVARFVLAASENAPEVFEALSSIAFGSLIADAVAGLSTSGVREMPDPALRVILDGPLILDFLGLNTTAHQEYAHGLFDLMHSAQLRLATFDHVVDEVRETIRAALRAYTSGSEYGLMGQRLRTSPGLSTKAASIADTLEERLGQLDVFILRSEMYERADFLKYFSDADFDRMRNAIGDVHHQLERRLRDTESVAAVVRLKRDNRKPSSVFQAGTIFLTRNSALYKRVSRALSLHRSEPDPRFTIVTDSQLAGVLWFSLGSSEKHAELSRRRLIANCAAAIVPQREVIHRISDFLEQIDPELKTEFATLMRDQRASLCPMRVTGGLVAGLDSETSFQVLEEMRAAIAEPYQERVLEIESAAVEERERLSFELSKSREIAAGLQDVIGSQEVSFDEQLAQLSLDLERQSAVTARMKTDWATRLGLRRDAYRDALRALDVDRRRVARTLKISWVLLALLAIGLSVFWGDINTLSVKIVVFLFIASTLSVFAPWLDQFFLRAAGLFFRRRQGELERLQDRVDELEALEMAE